MGRFDRYLLSQLVTLFGFVSLILIMVYWVNRAVRLFDQLIADGQGALVFLEFTLLSLPAIMATVLPLASFVAALFVANKLITDSELVVVQATGFSPWRLARPVLMFGLGVVLLVQVLSHILVPAAQSRLELRQYEVAQNATARLLQEGQFISPTEGLTLYISAITPQGELQNLFLSDTRSDDFALTYTAKTGYLVPSEANGVQLIMRDGMLQRYADGQLRVMRYGDFSYNIGEVIPTSPPKNRGYRELSTLELFSGDPALTKETGRSAQQLNLAAHDRIVEPGLGLLGALLGFSCLLLGGFSRFGVWRQIGLAIGLVIFIKALESAMTGLTRSTPDAWYLLYIPMGIGLGMSALLLLLAANPTWLTWRRAPKAPL